MRRSANDDVLRRGESQSHRRGDSAAKEHRVFGLVRMAQEKAPAKDLRADHASILARHRGRVDHED